MLLETFATVSVKGVMSILMVDSKVTKVQLKWELLVWEPF